MIANQGSSKVYKGSFFSRLFELHVTKWVIILYCKCVYYWLRHIKEDNILLSNFVMVGEKIGFKKENDKSFYSLILLEQRFPLKIFLAKYVRILVKSVQLGYSSGNLSDPLRIYQRIENRHMIPRNCFIWEWNTKHFIRKSNNAGEVRYTMYFSWIITRDQ